MKYVRPEILFDLNIRLKCGIGKFLKVYCALQCNGTSDYGSAKLPEITFNHSRCNSLSLTKHHQSWTFKFLIWIHMKPDLQEAPDYLHIFLYFIFISYAITWGGIRIFALCILYAHFLQLNTVIGLHCLLIKLKLEGKNLTSKLTNIRNISIDKNSMSWVFRKCCRFSRIWGFCSQALASGSHLDQG